MLIGGIRAGVAEVIGDGAGEEEGGLGDDADLVAIVGEVEGADILAVDEDVAVLEFVEAGEEAADAAFAGAGMADEGDGLAGGDGEGEVGEDGFAVGVAKADVLELDGAGEIGGEGVGLGDVIVGIDEGEDALGGGEAVLELAPEGGGAHHGAPEVADRLHVEEPLAGGDGAEAAEEAGVAGGEAADVEEDDGGEADGEFDDGGDGREGEAAAEVMVVALVVELFELVVKGVFLAEIFSDEDTTD